MKRSLPSLLLILSGLWLGSHIATGLIGAPAMFRLAGEGVFDSATAGTAAGTLFHGQLIFSSVVVLLMLAAGIGARDAFGPRVRGFLFTGIILGGALVLLESCWISPTIHSLRESLRGQFGSVANAPSDLPARRMFGMLHGLSMLRALGEMLCAVTVAVAVMRSRPSA